MSHGRAEPIDPVDHPGARDAMGADIGGEVVLMSGDAGKYYGLDEIGSAIWRRLEAPISVETLCSDLAADHDAAPAIIECDVTSLLDDFLAQGLIEMKG